MATQKELIIKDGIREGFRSGTSRLAERACYGYIKSKENELVVIKAEADIVRWIFECYLAGNSLGKIANRLAAQGIPSPTGNVKWNRQAIYKLLSNEKYAGCALLQKTFTEDGRQIRNNGQEKRYLYHNNNPAIISLETFKAVQNEKSRRSKNLEQATSKEWIMSL